MSSVNACRLGRMVAMFKYSTVTTYSVFLPPKKLEFSSSIKGEFLMQESNDVCALTSVPFCFYVPMLLYIRPYMYSACGIVLVDLGFLLFLTPGVLERDYDVC